MRIFTLIATHAGGSLPDGSAAPTLPQNHSILLSAVKAVSLLPTFKGDALTTIDTQLLSLQLVSGESLPLTINRAPGNVTNRQKMEDKFKSLVADLADESKLAIEWQYEELS